MSIVVKVINRDLTDSNGFVWNIGGSGNVAPVWNTTASHPYRYGETRFNEIMAVSPGANTNEDIRFKVWAVSDWDDSAIPAGDDWLTEWNRAHGSLASRGWSVIGYGEQDYRLIQAKRTVERGERGGHYFYRVTTQADIDALIDTIAWTTTTIPDPDPLNPPIYIYNTGSGLLQRDLASNPSAIVIVGFSEADDDRFNGYSYGPTGAIARVRCPVVAVQWCSLEDATVEAVYADPDQLQGEYFSELTQAVYADLQARL